MNYTRISEQAKIYDSFYFYDETVISEAIHALQSSFSGIGFLYSLKTNTNTNIVKYILSQGFGADAASRQEVQIAHDCGLRADQIQYSTPGKTRHDIEAALDKATIIADSPNEVELIDQVAKEKQVVAAIGIRINPDFSFSSDRGNPSKFGIDEEQVFSLLPQWCHLQHVKIIGIHVHVRSQELQAPVLAAYYQHMMTLGIKIQNQLGTPLAFINMGSGIGIPYSEQQVPIDITALGKMTAQLVTSARQMLPQTRIYVETGRYLVGKAGVYVTKVLDKKSSYGTTFVILKNTLNGFLRPSLAQLVSQYSPDAMPAANEPLFTCPDEIAFIPLQAEAATEKEVVTLMGNLCTATDVVAKGILLPKLEIGDFIIMTNAGSYAAVLSPFQFSSQERPVEMYTAADGKISIT